jgi:diamine N-acetyltransferase
VTEKGRGYGRATLALVTRQAFQQYAAHRLWLDVMPHNERALSLYRSAGFVEEGLLRDVLFDGERFRSLVVMSILRTEWTR